MKTIFSNEKYNNDVIGIALKKMNETEIEKLRYNLEITGQKEMIANLNKHADSEFEQQAKYLWDKTIGSTSEWQATLRRLKIHDTTSKKRNAIITSKIKWLNYATKEIKNGRTPITNLSSSTPPSRTPSPPPSPPPSPTDSSLAMEPYRRPAMGPPTPPTQTIIDLYSPPRAVLNPQPTQRHSLQSLLSTPPYSPSAMVPYSATPQSKKSQYRTDQTDIKIKGEATQNYKNLPAYHPAKKNKQSIIQFKQDEYDRLLKEKLDKGKGKGKTTNSVSAKGIFRVKNIM